VRVLLDENLPRGLKHDLVGHEVLTVPEVGWSGIADADLLQRAGARFEVLVTADRNLEFQQGVSAGSVGVVVLMVPNTRLQTVRSLVPAILVALETIRAATVVRLEEPHR
jgi:predicted nuclease of predicted toxin-antitoxin system